MITPMVFITATLTAFRNLSTALKQHPHVCEYIHIIIRSRYQINHNHDENYKYKDVYVCVLMTLRPCIRQSHETTAMPCPWHKTCTLACAWSSMTSGGYTLSLLVWHRTTHNTQIIIRNILISYYTPAQPKVEWGYAGFIHPFDRPSLD